MIPSHVRIFVCTERQDMRRSFDALALAVQERMALDPQSGALFVFASKRGNRLKVLWFDRNGYCIWKRSRDSATLRSSPDRRIRPGSRQLGRKSREVEARRDRDPFHFQLAFTPVYRYRLPATRPPDFASSSMESPVHNERRTPGLGRGTQKPTGASRERR